MTAIQIIRDTRRGRDGRTGYVTNFRVVNGLVTYWLFYDEETLEKALQAAQ